MTSRPYFTIAKDSFEKNAGYKSTVHALSELIDNSVEEDATHVAVVLMIDRQSSRLRQIAVIDNGNGMSPDTLQSAICEKSGKHLDRKYGNGSGTQRKFGKYGVGLPKASISQCNKFTVWSWQGGGSSKAFMNSIDIEDDAWIKAGAQVSASKSEAAPTNWLTAASLESTPKGTLVLWDRLDGLTWSRARWGANHGLIPNLEFSVGRVYRKFLSGDPPPLRISIHVIDEGYRSIETLNIQPNDPLYLTAGQAIPRLDLPNGQGKHPTEDPLFDEVTGTNSSLEMQIPGLDGQPITTRISWRSASAKSTVFAKFNGQNAGNLPHGVHARRNMGISFLREGREVDLTLALSNMSEPRERWVGLEVCFPHELDRVLGMTNNKQSYTRLEQILRQQKEEHVRPGESTSQCLVRITSEDPVLAACLQIAWTIQGLWHDLMGKHLHMREGVINPTPPGNPSGKTTSRPDLSNPLDAAEGIATAAQEAATGGQKPYETDPEKAKQALSQELQKQGMPRAEAEQNAERVVANGLYYAILTKKGIGSPFFTVGPIVDTNVIHLNEDHAIYPFLSESTTSADGESLESALERFRKTRIAVLLMLEAWAALERAAVDDERKLFGRIREDWGRRVEEFVKLMNKRPELAGDGRSGATPPEARKSAKP